MCTCASCKYTDSFADKGFAAWPRGEPAGAASSASAYRAHWSHCNAMRDPVKMGGPFPQRFPYSGIAPIAPNMTAIRWNAGRKMPDTAEAVPARPHAPGKAREHLPELDRQREPGTIYDMRKEKAKQDEKRARGRPELPGRKVLIKLPDELIAKAEKLGDGNVSEGTRRALERVKVA